MPVTCSLDAVCDPIHSWRIGPNEAMDRFSGNETGRTGCAVRGTPWMARITPSFNLPYVLASPSRIEERTNDLVISRSSHNAKPRSIPGRYAPGNVPATVNPRAEDRPPHGPGGYTCARALRPVPFIIHDSGKLFCHFIGLLRSDSIFFSREPGTQEKRCSAILPSVEHRRRQAAWKSV